MNANIMHIAEEYSMAEHQHVSEWQKFANYFLKLHQWWDMARIQFSISDKRRQ